MSPLSKKALGDYTQSSHLFVMQRDSKGFYRELEKQSQL